ncbi:4a88525c-3879-4092-bbe6-d59be0d62099 [Thermothielavioides terrestris]|uniref:4a88525c-3879-4092-bbe6-d59be0d62099 n=1 Tax=Thermothielavioides terrestris TaxID=2587410 RepID=A0A3S4C673_9PEZI|nr:4a88525c-3879-4092-bbe6-d59be0d62099 [Thermothielavioides terrestris]
MAGDDQSDPFLWDEDRVVQELCTSKRTWVAPPAGKLPNPAALEARLREHGVDGESLLTYLDEFEPKQMWDYLGVKVFSHQQSLKRAIIQFRRRSPRYREWKAQQQLADDRLCDEEDDRSATKPPLCQAASSERAVQAAAVSGGAPPADVHAGARPPTPGLIPPNQGVLSPALSPSAAPDAPASSDVPVSLTRDQEPRDEPPSKKRRIAPTTISAEPTGNKNLAVIPTEGDMFLREAAESLLHADDSSGFLGMGILLVDQLTDPQALSPTDVAEYHFSWVKRQIPPGRRIQVSAAMKRFLRSNHADRLRHNRDGDEETTLPPFGESEDESEDSETWREYQKEEEERLALEARKAAAKEKLLGKDELTEVVENVIQELESRWLAEKKPKCDRKAWRIWQDARRNPDRLARIESEKRHLAQLESRIARFAKQIVDQQWTAENDVHRKASDYLEMSVFDKKYQAWLIDVLQSPRQPPKPSTLPRVTPKRVKPPVLSEDDEEVLTSDSDDMDAFIEYDDNPISALNDDMELDSVPPPERTTVRKSRAADDSTISGAEAAISPPAAPETPSGEQAGHDIPPAQPTPRRIKAEQALLPVTPARNGPSAPEVIEIDSSPSPVKLLEVPGFDDLASLEKIGQIGTEYWEKVGDAERLVVAILCGWPRPKLEKLHTVVKRCSHPETWVKFIGPTLESPKAFTPGTVGFLFCRLFDAFVSKSAKRINVPVLNPITCQRIDREGAKFAAFYAYLGTILPLFLHTTPETPTRTMSKATAIPEGDADTSDGSASDDMPVPSTKKRRRRKRRDQNAENLRNRNLKLNEELARRSRQFHERMAEQGSVPGDKSRLIVNVTKESDEQGLIYINDHIGRSIKDHQIQGVRFMWNQVVVDSSVRQGCLLAHSMGLGKTMQVITLLVVIAESSSSPDESVRSQIPESLRQSQTLILCPASLVDNWVEEISIWAPGGVLGPVHKMDASLSSEGRTLTLQHWASAGGVLIIGYTMFTTLIRSDEETAKLLLETPNLVIGDEAHYMKNPESQRHQATANFKTMSRIAMTGSPLTNNVMDYYAMINWVAPNYLADIAEFRERFSNPIKEGLYADSEPHQKRKARRMLHVLKATVDPKVHRRDIQVLYDELPRKKEFIITLPLTKLQMRLYQTYIEWVTNLSGEAITGQARAWSLVAKLGLVLAHPAIFKTVAEAQKAKTGGSKAQLSKAAKAAKAEEGDEGETGVEMPQDVLFRLLGDVAVREIEDYALSNKILVLLRILEECKKVGDKVLVFSQSIPTLDYVENIFQRQRVVYQRLDGNTPVTVRQDSVKKFNTNAASQVYLISTRAGGVGLNIHGANRVVIFDFKYTPADEQQAIGRAYRLGQTKPVYVYWLTIGGTFEDTIHNNAIFKTQLASRVVDKKNPDPWSKRLAEYFAMPRIPDQEDLSGAFGQDQVLDALLKSEDIGKLIRKITSTETFEKEETYELTPEEKREADRDIELERLRSQNPEEYRRRERERAWQSRTALGMPPPPSSSSYQPPPIDGTVVFGISKRRADVRQRDHPVTNNSRCPGSRVPESGECS